MELVSYKTILHAMQLSMLPVIHSQHPNFFQLNVRLDVSMETALHPTIALVTLDGEVFDVTKVRALELYVLLFTHFFPCFLVTIVFIAW